MNGGYGKQSCWKFCGGTEELDSSKMTQAEKNALNESR